MPKPVKNFEVALSYSADAKSWGLSMGKGSKFAPNDFPPIKVPYGYSGQVTFKIVDSPGVTFDPTNPILAAPVTNPPSKPTALDAQFKVLPSTDPTTLIVADLNGVPGKPHQGYSATDYNYVLNFVNAEQIDPIISNSGCCRVTGDNFLSSSAGVMTIALIAVAVFAVLILRRRSVAMSSMNRDSD